MRVTVIIPIYNAEKYLSECIEGVLGQSMADFELLLIDDGSRDSSPMICDRYAAQDPRIQVYHIENGGVSHARNVGLDHASGEFIVFIDADDRILPNHLQQFLDSGIGEDGIAFSNFLRERPDGRILTAGVLDCNIRDDHEGMMATIAHLLRTNSFGWCWCKMFSRATIERYHLRFAEDCDLAEDEIFTAEYCLRANHIVCNSHPTYRYRLLSDSLLHKVRKPEQSFRAWTYILHEYERMGYKDEVFYVVLRLQLSRLRQILKKDVDKWNCDLSNEMIHFLRTVWRNYCHSLRRRYIIEARDLRYICLGFLIFGPHSNLWAKFMIKGLRL